MKHALITGANRGIGLEFCRQLAARGVRVFATCRTSSRELDALSSSSGGAVRVIAGVDVTSDAAVERLARDEPALAGVQLDLLINNAGVLRRESLDDLDFERIREQFEINSLGPLRVTAALVREQKLGRGSKVAIITSRMGSITDNTSGSRYGYRMSKAAVNMAGATLARDLESRGIAVALLHPGWVRTDMTDQRGLVDVDESVTGLLARIDELTVSRTGGFWHSNGERLPW